RRGCAMQYPRAAKKYSRDAGFMDSALRPMRGRRHRCRTAAVTRHLYLASVAVIPSGITAPRFEYTRRKQQSIRAEEPVMEPTNALKAKTLALAIAIGLGSPAPAVRPDDLHDLKGQIQALPTKLGPPELHQ